VNLAEVQELFWKAMRNDPMPPEIEAEFVGDARLSSRERMKIYQRMYWYRQVDVLWEIFPILSSIMGEREFTQMACRYIAVHPSTHFALERLGGSMAEFLANNEGAHSVFVDVAKLEWAHLLAIVAPNPTELAQVSDIDPSRFAEMRLVFAPAVQVLRLDARAFAFWDRFNDAPRREQEPIAEWPTPPVHTAPSLCGNGRPPTESRSQDVVERVACVYRPRHASQYQVYEGSAADALERAAKGRTMAEACEPFLASLGDANANDGAEVDVSTQVAAAFALFHKWFSLGLVERLESTSSSTG
jgi:hypothetical protein